VDDGRSQGPPVLRVVENLTELPDEELMLRHGRGESGVFDVLVNRHKGRVFGLLRRMGLPPSRAEELVADVFLKLHRAAPRYEPRAKFTTYLHTVAWRAAVNALDKARNQLDRGVAEPNLLEQAAAPAAPANHPERALATSRAFERVDAELAELPPGLRAVFVLYYAQGLSCADIAETLDISPAEAKGRLAYSRKLLRSRLAPWLQERNG
jgi:RNA polymerase sigma-70 factor, ECF subfamily